MLAFIGSLFGAGRIAGIIEQGLKFLSSWTALAILVLGVVWYAYASGASSERAACNAEQVAAENAELKRRLEATARVAEADRAQLDREKAAVNELEQKVSRYERDLEARGGGKCPLSADDIRGLQ